MWPGGVALSQQWCWAPTNRQIVLAAFSVDMVDVVVCSLFCSSVALLVVSPRVVYNRTFNVLVCMLRGLCCNVLIVDAKQMRCIMACTCACNP